jgi:hypothetical protein
MQIREWLESVMIPVGGEGAWGDGRFRLWLDRIEIPAAPRGWLGRWLGRSGAAPTGYRVALRLATPTHPAFEWASSVELPGGLPRLLGPFYEDGPLLAPHHTVVFELAELAPEGAYVVARAGRGESPPDIEVHGHLGALDAAAQRFVRAWLEQPARQRLAGGRRGAQLHAAELEGYSLRLAPSISGSMTLTFHRDGERFFVRTYGGCVAAIETWYGPFVERGGSYELEP